ncbi:YigZ family protein [Flagellimonas sp. HMM57]|uniref:IMPACT family protein n=1 Tax=unclassified Flagellimonas TaxID=2644544 RepID=UPI0013D069EE|nr:MULTISPECIES: YigZ family protein [unclassified Flagellimonas]UII78000.1 YigZ family protein [Flagellimonas sp. HMM57]
MKADDIFKTIAKPSDEILYKDRKSKFYGYAFPITSEDAIKPIIEMLRKKHHTANHVCYAWQLGEKTYSYRANDDGEPNNSAGMPIYGQIQAFEITNVLVAVARIFGGTKLGVGGLIQAYRTAAQIALENASIVEKTIASFFELHFEYPIMDKVMRIIKQKGITIVSQKMELTCILTISVRESEGKQIKILFDEMQHIAIKALY